MEGLCKS